MVRILPFIDGVSSIRGIARLADADYKMVREAIAHLVYYGCVVLLDVFNFNASYAPSSEIGLFVEDPEMQEEGRRYALLADTQQCATIRPEARQAQIDGARLLELYSSLKQGQSIKAWCMEHADIVDIIDVRRFITFGVIKGIVYRIHKYVTATSRSAGLSSTSGPGTVVGGKVFGDDRRVELARFLDGTHCFDEICTELMLSEKELLRRLKDFNDVQIIQK